MDVLFSFPSLNRAFEEMERCVDPPPLMNFYRRVDVAVPGRRREDFGVRGKAELYRITEGGQYFSPSFFSLPHDFVSKAGQGPSKGK